VKLQLHPFCAGRATEAEASVPILLVGCVIGWQQHTFCIYISGRWLFLMFVLYDLWAIAHPTENTVFWS
jgi:hypothetical protein